MIFHFEAVDDFLKPEISERSMSSALKREFGSEFLTVVFSVLDPLGAAAKMEAALKPYFQEDIILVGQGFGGMFADYWAEKYDLKAVLVDPWLEPQEILKHSVWVTEPTRLAYACFSATEKVTTYKVVFISARENPNTKVSADSKFGKNKVRVLKNGRYSAQNLEAIIDAVEFASNTFSDPVAD